MPIEIDWQVTEAPDFGPGDRSAARGAPGGSPNPEDNPPLASPGPRRSRRALRWVVLLALLVSAATAGLWHLTRTGWREVSGEVVALARYEDQLARQREIALLLRLQDPGDSNWRVVQVAQAERGQPAPLPAPRLQLLDVPVRFDGVAPVDSGAVRVDGYRQYRSPTGTLLTFRVPQFYRRHGRADWQRVNVPGSFWGEWLDWRSPHLALRYAQRDRELVEQLGPVLEERLSEACLLWGALCSEAGPAQLFLSGFVGALEYDPLRNVQVRVEAPAGPALPAGAFLAVPSPQLAGIPVDESSLAFLADYLSVRAIAYQAQRISPTTAHALMADAFFVLGLRHADPGFVGLADKTASAGQADEALAPGALAPAGGEPPAHRPPARPTPTPYRHLATYLVQPGDTLWAIATSYGVAVERIAAANALPDADNIAPGQILLIPKP